MRSILSPETTTTVSRSVPPLPSSRVATLRAIGRLGCGSSQVSGGLFATPSSAADGCDCTDFMRLIASPWWRRIPVELRIGGGESTVQVFEKVLSKEVREWSY